MQIHSKDPRDRSNGPGAWPTEWSVDVTKPTDQQAACQSLDALVDEGIHAAGILPTRQRCEELDEQLRECLARLIPVVQAQADAMDRGEVAWYGRQRLLDDTAAVLAEGLGLGLRSAALHVHALARCCRGLADYADGS